MESFIIEIKTTGDYTAQELKDYIVWQLGGGSLDSDNPFIKDKSEAEILDCEVF